MDRQRIEELVGDQHALERLGQGRGRCQAAVSGEAGEGRGMRAPGFGAGFDEMKTEPVAQRGMPLARRTEDIGGEPAVAGAGFDEIERSRNWEFGIENVETSRRSAARADRRTAARRRRW